jgi:predicted AAA+ superfamily ATPase
MPKFYFLDSGFRNIAIENFLEIGKRSDKGEINENFVASEISKKEMRLNYWKTKAGAEVDFIIEKENKLIAIEVKTLLKGPKYGKSFINFINNYHPDKGIILSLDYFYDSKMEKTRINFRPVYLVSYLLQ